MITTLALLLIAAAAAVGRSASGSRSAAGSALCSHGSHDLQRINRITLHMYL